MFSYMGAAYIAGILTGLIFMLIGYAIEKAENWHRKQEYKKMRIEKEILLAKAKCRREFNNEKRYRA